MIKRILIFLGIFMVLSLLAAWLFTGGVSRIKNATTLFTNPVDLIFYDGSLTSNSIRLPWQPIELPRGPDIEGTDVDNGTPQEQLEQLQERYEELVEEAQRAKTFGDPSPDVGKAQLYGQDGAQESELSAEYIEIRSRSSNTAPLSTAGWSLQSALTGVRMYLPTAASPFVGGAVNQTAPVQLSPESVIIVGSGPSPVGVSFRENACTGYLQQFQSFYPELRRECPDPSAALPVTADNVHMFGDSCIDFVRTLTPCVFPQEVPADLIPSCTAHISNIFSYNGCVSRYAHKPGFAQDSWRLYLSSAQTLWRDTHDVIRLLDAQGRTIDVMVY